MSKLLFLLNLAWISLAFNAQAQDFSACGDGGQLPCEIDSWADLHAMRTALDKTYRLTTNLSSETPGYATYAGPTANGGVGWLPIGVWESEFVGSFDGGGYHIADLTISKTLADREVEGFIFGLFGFVGKPQILGQGILQSVVLKDIDYRLACDPMGGLFFGLVDISMGGLAGFKQQSIEARNIEVSGRIQVDLSDCGDSPSFLAEVGGVIGFNRGILANSLVDVDVSLISNDPDSLPDFAHVGGVVGFNQGEVSAAASYGDVSGPVAGGITGFNDSQTLDSYAMAEVTGLFDSGGIAGRNQGQVARSYFSGPVTVELGGDIGALIGEMITGSVTASYWDQDVVGELTDPEGTGLDGSAMRVATSFEGWDFSTTGPWIIQEGAFRSYPYLRAFIYDDPETEEPTRAIPGLEAICPLGSFSETGYAPCQPCLAGTNTNDVGAEVCRIEKVPTLNITMLAWLTLLLAVAGLLGIRRL